MPKLPASVLKKRRAERDAAEEANPDRPPALNLTPGAPRQRLKNRRAAPAAMRPTKADFGPAKKMRGGGMMKTKGYMAGGKMKTKGHRAGGKVRGAGIARKGVRPAKMR